jgi:hypothetical protein
VPTGIAFSPDGATGYVAFSRSNTLAIIDALVLWGDAKGWNIPCPSQQELLLNA